MLSDYQMQNRYAYNILSIKADQGRIALFIVIGATSINLLCIQISIQLVWVRIGYKDIKVDHFSRLVKTSAHTIKKAENAPRELTL